MIAWSSDMPDLRFVQTGSAILPHGAGSAGSHTKQARVGDTALHHPRATDCRNFETICERCGFFETGPQFLTILRRQHDHADDHNQPDPAQLFTEILESVAWTGTPPAGALAATPVAAIWRFNGSRSVRCARHTIATLISRTSRVRTRCSAGCRHRRHRANGGGFDIAGCIGQPTFGTEGEGLWPQFGQPVCHLGAVVHHPADGDLAAIGRPATSAGALPGRSQELTGPLSMGPRNGHVVAAGNEAADR